MQGFWDINLSSQQQLTASLLSDPSFSSKYFLYFLEVLTTCSLTLPPTITHTLPLSLTPSNYHSHPPTITHSLPPTVCVTPSLPLSLTLVESLLRLPHRNLLQWSRSPSVGYPLTPCFCTPVEQAVHCGSIETDRETYECEQLMVAAGLTKAWLTPSWWLCTLQNLTCDKNTVSGWVS